MDKVRFTLKACGGTKVEIVEVNEVDGITSTLEDWVRKNITYYFDYEYDERCSKCANFVGDETYVKAYCDRKREIVDAKGVCSSFITLDDLRKKYE